MAKRLFYKLLVGSIHEKKLLSFLELFKFSQKKKKKNLRIPGFQFLNFTTLSFISSKLIIHSCSLSVSFNELYFINFLRRLLLFPKQNELKSLYTSEKVNGTCIVIIHFLEHFIMSLQSTLFLSQSVKNVLQILPTYLKNLPTSICIILLTLQARMMNNPKRREM